MTTTYKRLGATTVVADTNTGLYTVPASTSAIVSSLTVCNTSSSSATFRIAHVDGAIGVVSAEDYLYYNIIIPANDTFSAEKGITMSAGDTLLVRSNSISVVFSVHGSEVS